MSYFLKAAEIWRPDETGRALSLSGAYYPEIQEFANQSRAMKFAWDEGLPGKTWAAAQPLIWTNLQTAEFLRRDLAREANLACGLSIPIMAGDILIAVVVLFASAEAEASGALEVWQNRENSSNELFLEDGYYGNLEKFEWISRRLTMMRGRGLPGQAWQEQVPLIINDLPNANTFLRARNAAECGVSSGLAIPLTATNGRARVVTLLSTLATPIAHRFEIWQPNLSGESLQFQSGFCSVGTDLVSLYRDVRVAKQDGALGSAWATGIPAIAQQDLPEKKSWLALPYIHKGSLNALLRFTF